ncbi:hypothetical protein ACQ4PT_064800 [Festuca glaucescens]
MGDPGSGDCWGDSTDGTDVHPGGRFWAIADVDSDGKSDYLVEEDDGPAVEDDYFVRTPVSVDCVLQETARVSKRIEKQRRQRLDSTVLNLSSSPVHVHAGVDQPKFFRSSPVARRGPILSPSIFTEDSFDAKEWIMVTRRKTRASTRRRAGWPAAGASASSRAPARPSTVTARFTDRQISGFGVDIEVEGVDFEMRDADDGDDLNKKDDGKEEADGDKETPNVDSKNSVDNQKQLGSNSTVKQQSMSKEALPSNQKNMLGSIAFGSFRLDTDIAQAHSPKVCVSEPCVRAVDRQGSHIKKPLSAILLPAKRWGDRVEGEEEDLPSPLPRPHMQFDQMENGAVQLGDHQQKGDAHRQVSSAARKTIALVTAAGRSPAADLLPLFSAAAEESRLDVSGDQQGSPQPGSPSKLEKEPDVTPIQPSSPAMASKTRVDEVYYFENVSSPNMKDHHAATKQTKSERQGGGVGT